MNFFAGVLRFLVSLLLLATVTSSLLRAGEDNNPVVLELFTSQGCPGCPPADALLKRIGSRDGILTLSWPIDYWDRLGWEDTLASPDNAVRQMAYNKRLGVAGVFTPELIINGNSWLKGNDQATLDARLAEAMTSERKEASAELVAETGGAIRIVVKGTRPDQELFVRYVWYRSDINVEISGGVNEGRTLHYTNVVRGSEVMDDFTGANSTNYRLEASTGRELGADHLAILVHEGYGHGPVIAAASIALP